MGVCGGMQVVVRVAPQPALAELHARFLRGHLASLAGHACANFVVQAYLAALATPQQVRPCPPVQDDVSDEKLRAVIMLQVPHCCSPPALRWRHVVRVQELT